MSKHETARKSLLTSIATTICSSVTPVCVCRAHPGLGTPPCGHWVRAAKAVMELLDGETKDR